MVCVWGLIFVLNNIYNLLHEGTVMLVNLKFFHGPVQEEVNLNSIGAHGKKLS